MCTHRHRDQLTHPDTHIELCIIHTPKGRHCVDTQTYTFRAIHISPRHPHLQTWIHRLHIYRMIQRFAQRWYPLEIHKSKNRDTEERTWTPICHIYTPCHHLVFTEHPQSASHAPRERAPHESHRHRNSSSLISATWDYMGALSPGQRWRTFFSVVGHQPMVEKIINCGYSLIYKRKKLFKGKQPNCPQMGI